MTTTLLSPKKSQKLSALFTKTNVAASIAVFLTLSFWLMCRRSLITNAPTWVDGPVLDILESFRMGRVYQADALRTMPYTVLTHTPLSYVVDYSLYRFWPGFAALRFINILATVACSVLVFVWVRKRTEGRPSALFAASVFLLMPPVFQWSQTTRSPDAFCCLFSLGAILALDSEIRYRNALIAVLFSAAVLSKQTALIVLAPTLLACEYRQRRQLRGLLSWLLLAAVVLVLFVLAMQHATAGGFWTAVVDANFCNSSINRLLFVVVRRLFFFWIFVACTWRSFGRRYTSAHIWAVVSISVGLATCGKAGSDTMYFFDAGAAVALIAGLTLSTASARRVAAVALSLLLCVFISDRFITHTTDPIVGKSFRRMLDDLRPFPTILSDESSISIETGRPWSWGDPLVLSALGRQGKWNGGPIDVAIGEQRYSAIVIWNRAVWPATTWQLLQQKYVLWKTYPAFKSYYSVYLPLHDATGKITGK